MGKFLLETGRIPKNIDLEVLFGDINESKTILKNLKDGCIYILSLITTDNYSLRHEKDGFITLNNNILEKIVGQKRPTFILKLLLDNNIIEVRKKVPLQKSCGYRLSEKYNIGEFTYIDFSKKISNNIKKYKQKIIDDEVKIFESSDLSVHIERSEECDYSFLTEQFQKNRISIDYDESLDFINTLGVLLLEKVETLNSSSHEWSKQTLYNYIGRLINIVDDFNSDCKCIEPQLSLSNHRFQSKITTLPKILRPFLRINGEFVGEVDICSSQPYILSTILNTDFCYSKTKGYNLFTIFPRLFVEIENSKKFSVSHTPDRKNELFGVWFNDNEFQELRTFLEFDFTNDFYNNLISEGVKLKSPIISNTDNLLKERNYLKKHMMNFLFNRNDNHRENDEVIKLIKEVYPQMCRFINYFHQQYTSSDFSYLLQRTESYLVLGSVCSEINKLNRNIPFYTIHDSIITTQTFLDQVKDVMTFTIRELTGKSFNVKVKTYNTTDYLTSELVEEVWKESILITTLKKYDRKRKFYLGINISRGKELLNGE